MTEIPRVSLNQRLCYLAPAVLGLSLWPPSYWAQRPGRRGTVNNNRVWPLLTLIMIRHILSSISSMHKLCSVCQCVYFIEGQRRSGLEDHMSVPVPEPILFFFEL